MFNFVQKFYLLLFTLLSSPYISGKYCMEAPTLDSQYND